MLKLLGVYAQGVVAAGAYESIASATGTGSSGTITFSSIPSTYQHLQIRGIARTSGAGTGSDLLIRLNSDTGSNYTQHRIWGIGSSVFAGASSGDAYAYVFNAITATSAIASNMGAIILDIHDYSSSSKTTTVRSISGFDNNGSGSINLISNLWTDTDAVNSISLIAGGSGNWTTDTQFALYGIKGA